MAPPKKKPDDLVVRLDSVASSLLDKATAEGVGLQEGLDCFKEVARWVAIKKGLTPPDGGESLDELKRKLGQANGTTGGRTARGKPLSGGNQFAASHARFAHRPDGDGGSALDAIRAKVPRPDIGDDAGAGHAAIGAGAGNGGPLRNLHIDDDGDD